MAVGWFLPALSLDFTEAQLRNAVNVLAGADATMLGFLVSAGALIFAVAQTTLVRNLYRTGHVQRLLGSLFFDAGLFFLSLVAGLVCLLLTTSHESSHLMIGVRVLFGLNAAALCALVPVAHTLYHLLMNIGPRDGKLEQM